MSPGSRRYALDSYQREYAWTDKQIEELINDLTVRFVKEWSPKHELKDVAPTSRTSSAL
jgi:hypothetical protein